MRLVRTLALLLAATSAPLAAQSPKEQVPPPSVAASLGTPPPGAAALVQTAPLTKENVDAWLDGYMPYALRTADIAGAVVVVVKDGQVLTQRGFGYADVKARKPVDPATTMFRPGSTSKLFTWTAIMQLVQAGKIDLDTDVNRYLDFKIPPAFNKPITVRDLMTHRAGFEEANKSLIAEDPAKLATLEAALKRWVPTRIYAPGTMPAYSNYGASLAGYIVQRVSGEPFDRYVERHIYAPLGMAHATFTQPLPARFAADMAEGYAVASEPAHKYELIALAPAGSMAASGGDMAKFMIAHLAGGGPLLSPATAQLMHRVNDTPVPGVPGMALGFYHEDRNGLDIIGHAGDLDWFHSDLHLYLDKGVGLFVSMNSAGKQGGAHTVREQLFDEFTNRYFPDASAALPTVASAKADAAAMAGTYYNSRASASNWLRMFGFLGEAKVAPNEDGTLTVSALTNAAGVPKRWREIGPFLWQEVGGNDRLGAVVQNGHVTAFAPAGMAPIFLFLPATGLMNSAWSLPVLLLCLGVLAITAIRWPWLAIVRRRYGHRAATTGRPLLLYRGSRVTAWLLLLVGAGWAGVVTALSVDVNNLDGRLDPWMRVIQLLTVAAAIGSLLAVWNAWVVIRTKGRPWFAVVWAVLIALASLFLVWFLLDMRTVTATLNY